MDSPARSAQKHEDPVKNADYGKEQADHYWKLKDRYGGKDQDQKG